MREWGKCEQEFCFARNLEKLGNKNALKLQEKSIQPSPHQAVTFHTTSKIKQTTASTEQTKYSINVLNKLTTCLVRIHLDIGKITAKGLKDIKVQ